MGGGLVGEAAGAGAQLAAAVSSYCGAPPAHLSGRRDRPCLIWGGETTVTLPAGVRAGAGGRCQELALAAARALASERRPGCGPSLLAAGTDGRDGATDAAGAIIDACSWRAIARAGRDPAADLAAHESYHALDAVGALLRTGLTGTNVMDVAIAICDGLTA
jgi:hydroxypyruvate reductase